MHMLFIHRSVGAHLIRYGDLRAKLNAQDIQFDDYDNNLGTLTHDSGTTDSSAISISGNNTNPDNLEAFFSQWNNILDDYDLVMIKSCYPNSHIKSDKQLEKVKRQYQRIIKAFIDHKKQLLILTTPPLRPFMTNKAEAQRANKLAAWLMSQAKDNIHVFDFRKLLVNDQGMLKASYRHRFMPWDNHPKAKAHIAIAPQIIDFITSATV
jgi:hypothetical protein